MRNNLLTRSQLVAKIFLITSLFLLSFMSSNTNKAHALCYFGPPAGQWVNDSDDPSLILRTTISPPCRDTIDSPIGGNPEFYAPPTQNTMIHIVALCETGVCNWGWSPGTRHGNTYTDTRHWFGSKSFHNFKLMADGRLQITTTAYLPNKEPRVFVDIMRQGSYPVYDAVPDYQVLAMFSVLGSTSDGSGEGKANWYDSATGGDNEWRPSIWFTRGVYSSRSHWAHVGDFPLNVGSIDIIFQLKEYDSWFNGENDHFDINPLPEEKNVHLRVFLESREIYLVRGGNLFEKVGRVNSSFELAERNDLSGEDRAIVRFAVFISKPSLPERLSLPKIPSSPVILPPPPSEDEEKSLTPENIPQRPRVILVEDVAVNAPDSTADCRRPLIVNFYATLPPEGSKATFTLHYQVEDADRVEIFGNLQPSNSGTFDVYDHPAASNWALWSKVNDTENSCYIEKVIKVTPIF